MHQNWAPELLQRRKDKWFCNFSEIYRFRPAEHVVSFWYFRVKSVGIFNLSRMDILLPLWRHAGPPKDKNLSSSDLNIFTLEQHHILKKTQATRVWRSYILVLRVIVLSLPAKQYSLSAQSSDICDGVQPPASTTEPQSHQYNPHPTHLHPHNHPPPQSQRTRTDSAPFSAVENAHCIGNSNKSR